MADLHEGQAGSLEVAHGPHAALDVTRHVSHGPEAGFRLRVFFGDLGIVGVHAAEAVSKQRMADLVAYQTSVEPKCGSSLPAEDFRNRPHAPSTPDDKK